MTSFIPIFPLSIVVYPGEDLNLHIFEPRYKQLIEDCFAENKPFGIPTVLNNAVADHGTQVHITNIKAVYDDGKMDISTQGGAVFALLEMIPQLPDKLYSGAIVNYPANGLQTNSALQQTVLQTIKKLHVLLAITKNFKKPDHSLTSYDLAHHAGLNLAEEFELLKLMQETQRLEYLRRHLSKVVPIIEEMETLKERVKLNGHFRELKGLGF
ncbi:MAG: peptidase S16 [Bacteroidetes bacterium]|nr:MAG: peptidase S16 [Bacteroidota bacterium]